MKRKFARRYQAALLMYLRQGAGGRLQAAQVLPGHSNGKRDTLIKRAGTFFTEVNIVHKFARKLRPAVLDDLGLIPALHSFMKNFTTRSGVRAGSTLKCP